MTEKILKLYEGALNNEEFIAYYGWLIAKYGKYWELNIKKANPVENRVGQPSELLPCPFCGSEAKIIERDNTSAMYGEERFDVGCMKEGCYLQYGAEYWHTKEKIINLWNKRASQ